MCCCTAAYPLQSYIFANLVEVFTFTGDKLKSRGDFWSLIFFILALGVGVCYFTLGYVSNHISVVSLAPCEGEKHNTLTHRNSSWEPHIDSNTSKTYFETRSHSTTEKAIRPDP